MAAADPISVLARLGASPSDRLAALALIRNEVVGTRQCKDKWVQLGVLAPLVDIVTAPQPASGSPLPQGSLDSTIRLQALRLLARFASTGPAFLSPLHAVGILPAVLGPACLQSHQPSAVLTSLQILRDLANAAASASASSPITTSSLANALFTTEVLSCFQNILSSAISPEEESRVSIVASLIQELCHEDCDRTPLVASGVLDALASRLASLSLALGFALPNGDVLARSGGLGKVLPPPATSTTSLEPVLGAIAAIVTSSPYRACKLVFSPSILAVFPSTSLDGSHYAKSAREVVELPGRDPKRLGDHPLNLLLPEAPPTPRSMTFPNVSSSSLSDGPSLHSRAASSRRTPGTSVWNPEDVSLKDRQVDRAESPLVAFLIYLARSRTGGVRLMAASVLASLFRTGFTHESREFLLGPSVVANLLAELEAEFKSCNPNSMNPTASDKARLRLVEEIPAVLAKLITDNESLQRACSQARAPQLLCKLLKSTYEAPMPDGGSRLWSPEPRDTKPKLNIPADECTLGDEGQNHVLLHRNRLRRSTLVAMAALTSKKEEYRKRLVDLHAMPYIVASLLRSPPRISDLADKLQRAGAIAASREAGGSKSKYGNNSAPVIMAACDVLRMLSRSPSILRTTMTDYSLCGPICALLSCDHVDIQLAVSPVITNFAHDVSPLREELNGQGILKTMCKLARSSNTTLRLNALWALKHLVNNETVEYKKACLEELGADWLVSLIEDDDNGEVVPVTSLEEMDEDMDMGLAADHGRNWLSSSFYRNASDVQQPEAEILRAAESELAGLRDEELDVARKAYQDDLKIQEQGLGLIRNMIGAVTNGPNSMDGTVQMIDHLIRVIGQESLFELLSSKIRAKLVYPYSRRGAGGPAVASEPTRVLPSPRIVEAAVYILVHIGASVPRHRQLLVSQTEMLKTLAKLLSSRDEGVRVALCHLINNLTWQDDVGDAPACMQRSIELRRLGFLSKLEKLGQHDETLDVRERAKSALWQMKQGN